MNEGSQGHADAWNPKRPLPRAIAGGSKHPAGVVYGHGPPIHRPLMRFAHEFLDNLIAVFATPRRPVAVHPADPFLATTGRRDLLPGPLLNQGV
jgi:hypothetical protein